ncbi:MAG: helix-turn-helix transcriptional regulator [Lewinella sp.]|nr:helix-turn-helix transcriptional regulator [Lewinella sp.]
MTETVRRAYHFVLSNLDRSELTVHDLALAVYRSERQFYREMKDKTGMTPYQFMQKIRLQQARRMAERHKVSSVERLARAVGYHRTDHFVRLFQEAYGIHPKDLLAP